ncbi:MAG: TetR/AcrR family transcriptional regulator [Leptospiraceae bacterium]|nr:TetR/AcrR family transcriptional regulator [Leptospiraceae bacterium]MDW7975230.1 TetR/AcrR family transcriptional regulator [Leptospiraceae bacterium]
MSNIQIKERTTKNKRERSERKIFQAAIKVIAEQGYHNTRISDIAKEAGVAYGLVYHYFGSKENIMQKIVDEVTKKFSEKIERINTEGIHTLEKLAKISDYIFDTYLASKEIIQLLINEVIKEPRINKEKLIGERIINKISAIIEEGKQKKEIYSFIEPKIFTLVFFGSIQMLLSALVNKFYEIDDSNKVQVIKKFKKQIRSMLLNDLEKSNKTFLSNNEL